MTLTLTKCPLWEVYLQGIHIVTCGGLYWLSAEDDIQLIEEIIWKKISTITDYNITLIATHNERWEACQPHHASQARAQGLLAFKEKNT